MAAEFPVSCRRRRFFRQVPQSRQSGEFNLSEGGSLEINLQALHSDDRYYITGRILTCAAAETSKFTTPSGPRLKKKGKIAYIKHKYTGKEVVVFKLPTVKLINHKEGRGGAKPQFPMLGSLQPARGAGKNNKHEDSPGFKIPRKTSSGTYFFGVYFTAIAEVRTIQFYKQCSRSNFPSPQVSPGKTTRS